MHKSVMFTFFHMLGHDSVIVFEFRSLSHVLGDRDGVDHSGKDSPTEHIREDVRFPHIPTSSPIHVTE